MTPEVQQAKFSGWAIVEMMGHRKEIGYVTTQAFGQAVLFQVDTPELPEREFVLPEPGYAEERPGLRRWCPKGTKVKRTATPARSCLVAPASLYAMNPCSEDAALRAIEHNTPRPLILLELPVVPQITAGEEPQENDLPEDDEHEDDIEFDDDEYDDEEVPL